MTLIGSSIELISASDQITTTTTKKNNTHNQEVLTKQAKAK